MHAERRALLIERMEPDSALLIPSTPKALRNGDVEHEYRADSDLFYLCGWVEPRSALLLLPGHEEGAFVLFARPRDAAAEQWDGAREGIEGAVGSFGAVAAYDIDVMHARLSELLINRRRLYYALGVDRAMDELVLRAVATARSRARKGAYAPTEIVEPSTVLHAMRWKKSEAESALMRRAAEVTAAGFARVSELARDGAYEYEVEAALRMEYRRAGSQRVAYEPIVASGANACVLHYIKNDRRMRGGELLLIDSGAEWGGYACDVTRTYPIGGEFSPAQRAVYEAVLAAQKACIDTVRVGSSITEVHDCAVRSLTGSMIAMGLLSGTVDERVADESFKRYYMHGTSHWLGMDVHDVGAYFEGKDPKKFEPGCVLTVEPGLYIAADDESAPPEFRGIGVRIEDDVLVTETGNEVLTAMIEKEIDAIERAFRAGASSR